MEGGLVDADIEEQVDAVARGLGAEKLEQAVEQGDEVERGELELDGFGEVEKSFDDAVEAESFLAEDADFFGGGGVGLADGGVEDLEVEADGVKGIFDFVSDAAGKGINGAEALGEVELVGEAELGFDIANGEEEAAGLENLEIEGNGVGAEGGGGAVEVLAQSHGAGDKVSGGGTGGEEFRDVGAVQLPAALAEEFFEGAAGIDEAFLFVEEENGVLHAFEQLLDVDAHLLEVFAGAANLGAEEAELGLDGLEFAGFAQWG